jgi:hypothetical protein
MAELSRPLLRGRFALMRTPVELAAREPQWQQRVVYTADVVGSLGEPVRECSVPTSDIEHAARAGIHGVEQHTIACRQDGVVPRRHPLDLAPVVSAESLVFSKRAVRSRVHRTFPTACS